MSLCVLEVHQLFEIIRIPAHVIELKHLCDGLPRFGDPVISLFLRLIQSLAHLPHNIGYGKDTAHTFRCFQMMGEIINLLHYSRILDITADHHRYCLRSAELSIDYPGGLPYRMIAWEEIFLIGVNLQEDDACAQKERQYE